MYQQKIKPGSYGEGKGLEDCPMNSSPWLSGSSQKEFLQKWTLGKRPGLASTAEEGDASHQWALAWLVQGGDPPWGPHPHLGLVSALKAGRCGGDREPRGLQHLTLLRQN